MSIVSAQVMSNASRFVSTGVNPNLCLRVVWVEGVNAKPAFFAVRDIQPEDVLVLKREHERI